MTSALSTFWDRIERLVERAEDPQKVLDHVVLDTRARLRECAQRVTDVAGDAAAEAELKAEVRRLEERLREAEVRGPILVARWNRAQAQLALGVGSGRLGGDAASRFDEHDDGVLLAPTPVATPGRDKERRPAASPPVVGFDPDATPRPPVEAPAVAEATRSTPAPFASEPPRPPSTEQGGLPEDLPASDQTPAEPAELAAPTEPPDAQVEQDGPEGPRDPDPALPSADPVRVALALATGVTLLLLNAACGWSTRSLTWPVSPLEYGGLLAVPLALGSMALAVRRRDLRRYQHGVRAASLPLLVLTTATLSALLAYALGLDIATAMAPLALATAATWAAPALWFDIGYALPAGLHLLSIPVYLTWPSLVFEAMGVTVFVAHTLAAWWWRRRSRELR